MSRNKESNGYIITFVVIMAMIVAISLSFVSSALKPLKDKNEMVDKKSKILKSVLDVSEAEEKKLLTADFVLNEFDGKITELVVDYQGEPKKGLSAFAIDFKKETRLPEKDRSYPVFLYSGESGTYYIIPMIGLGLWDEVSGYIALKDDFKTIKGAAFDHKGETPGLGARIVDYWFRKQMVDKKLFDDGGVYSFRFLKGEGHARVKTDPYVADGLSGATITVQGVDAMIETCIQYYKPFFEKQKNS